MRALGITAAGRIGNTWTPANLASLRLWLDASDAGTITMSGGRIATWTDLSGQGNTVSGGSGPTRTVTQNGRLVATFAAGDVLKRSGTGLMPSAGSIALVMRSGTPVPGYMGQPVNLTASNMPRPADHWQDADLNAMWSGDGGDPALSTSWHDLRSHVGWCSLVTTRSGAGQASQHRDGSLLHSATWGGGWSVAAQVLCIGARDDGVVSWVGDLAEAVVTDTVMSGAEISAWTDYCRDKWGTP